MLAANTIGVLKMDEILPRKTEKPWGYELLYAHTEQYMSAKLFL
jgi:hypothetical protein